MRTLLLWLAATHGAFTFTPAVIQRGKCTQVVMPADTVGAPPDTLTFTTSRLSVLGAHLILVGFASANAVHFNLCNRSGGPVTNPPFSVQWTVTPAVIK